MPEMVAAERSRSVFDDIKEMEQEALVDEVRRKQERKFLDLAKDGHVSLEEAQMIMGPNLWGPSIVIRYLNCRFDRELINQQTVVHYSAKMLRACRETHILFLGAGVDMIQLRALVAHDRRSVKGDFFYDNFPFARQQMPVRWYLVRKELLRGSLFKSYYRQELMLSDHEERLTAVEYAYFFILHKLKTRKWLLNHAAVISRSLMSSRAVIYVGHCNEDGVGVGTWDPQRAGVNLGLLPAIKPNVL